MMVKVYEPDVERLGMLYAMMAGVPDERVNLATWRGKLNRESDKNLFEDCGTTACAVGWACAYPPFKRMGLHWSRQDDGFGGPTYQNEFSWTAVGRFFGISESQAYLLFIKDRNELLYHDNDARLDSKLLEKMTDKQVVLMRIRNFLLKSGAIDNERWHELKRQERTGEFQFV